MKLELGEHPQGTMLAVRVLPGARRAGVRGVHGGALKVAVAQPAEKGRANEALLDLLAELLGVTRGQLELLSGATAPQKRVLICGIDRTQLLARLGKALAETPRQ